MDRKIHPLKARSRFKARLLLGMVLKPLRLFCDRCDKYMPSDMEWRCAHCGHHNENTRIYSFLNKCQNCKRVPKSVSCPECEKVNFLDRDKDGSHPAVKWGLPEPVATLEEAEAQRREKERLQKRDAHTDRKEDINREIEIADLEVNLAKSKSSIESYKKKPLVDRLREEGEEAVARVMGVHEAAEDLYAKNEEKYKKRPEKREQADKAVRNFVEDKSIES